MIQKERMGRIGMMNYAEEKMNEFVYMTKRSFHRYEIIEQTRTRLCLLDERKTIKTYEIVEHLTNELNKTYPEQDICVMKYEDKTFLNYWLMIEMKDQTIRLDYEHQKNGDTIEIWNNQENSTIQTPQIDSIKQVFKEFVEELPEFRLRLVTGELKIKMHHTF